MLEQTPILNEMLNTDNPDTQVAILTKVMDSSIDRCAPIVTKQINRPPAPWIDESLKNAMKERDEISKLLKMDRRNLVLEAEHKEKKKAVKSHLHKAKIRYF